VFERPVLERECERVRLYERRLDARPRKVLAGERELLRLDVDAVELDAGELLSEHGEHRTHPATDLEQTGAGRERGAVGDQPVTPVLRLRDEPLLLLRSVAVDVLGRPRFSTKRCRCSIRG
jgi:hypothetical protein